MDTGIMNIWMMNIWMMNIWMMNIWMMTIWMMNTWMMDIWMIGYFHQVLIRCKNGRRWCRCGDGSWTYYPIECGGDFPTVNCGTSKTKPMPDNNVSINSCSIFFALYFVSAKLDIQFKGLVSHFHLV